MTVGGLVSKLESIRGHYSITCCGTEGVLCMVGRPELFEDEVLIYTVSPSASISSEEFLKSLKKENEELTVKVVMREPKEIKSVTLAHHGFIVLKIDD